MSDIFKVIFELEAKGQGVLDELNKIKSKYVEHNAELKKNELLLASLREKEKALIAAQASTSSVNAEVKRQQELKKTRVDIDNVNKSLKSMKTTERDLVLETQRLDKALDNAFKGTRVKGFENDLKKANAAIQGGGGLGDKITGIVAGLGVAQLGREVISVTANFEKLEAVLINTLGSQSLAKKSLQEIKDFAAVTPFSVQELTESFVKLSNQGFIPTTNELRKLGDIASSQGKSFDQLTEAIIDAQTGEFERLKEFGIRASKEGDKVTFTFKGVKTQVDFTSKSIQNYILALGDAEGVSGSMAAISQTLGGQISNLGDAWDDFLNTLGTNTKPIISAAIDSLGLLLTSAKNFVRDLGGLFNGQLGERLNTDAITEALFFGGNGKFLGEGITEEVKKKIEAAAKRLSKAGVEVGNPNDLGTQKATESFAQLDAQFQSLAASINGKGTKEGEETIFKVLALQAQELKKRNDEGLDSLEEYTIKLNLLDQATQQAKDNQKLYNKSKEETKGLSKDQQKEIQKEIDMLKKLREELIKAQSVNRIVEIEDQLTGIDEIEAKYVELQTQQTHQFAVRREEINKDFKFQKQRVEALSLLSRIEVENDIKLQRERVKAILTEEYRLANEKAELTREAVENTLDTEIANTVMTEEEIAFERLNIVRSYYDEKIRIAKAQIDAEKKAGLNVTDRQTELDALLLKSARDVAKSRNDLALALKQSRLNELDETERHELAMAEIQGEAETKRLKQQLKFEEDRLQILKDSGKATQDELTKQSNYNEELREKIRKQEEAAQKKKIEGIIDGILYVTAETFRASNAIIQNAVDTKDKQISIQNQRIEEARSLAENGNAELLELEKDRLDRLLKEKERFVRAQQALSAIELVANAGVAIAKSAAEGGIAAPFTIAATLIALVAGLAQARAIAQQAAFYEGGYTGDGNPKEESQHVGKRPYKYHKAEFVMNHELTRKNRDVFEDLHKGRIDLQDWKRKVKLYDDFKLYDSRQISMPAQVINNVIELNELKSDMREIINVLKHQTASINLDENGFSAHLKGIQARNEFIRTRLAK